MEDKTFVDDLIESWDFQDRLKVILFGENYAERMTPEQLTDEKLLEAVRMLKEVY